jgi:hypothetical protein
MESMMFQSAKVRLQGVQSKLSFEDWTNPQFSETKVSVVSEKIIISIKMNALAILNLFQLRLLFHIRNRQLLPFSLSLLTCF